MESFWCKGLAYSLALSSFRGGPIFPSMFIGAAGGIALSHLPGAAHDRGRRDGNRRDDGGDALGLPLTSVLIVSVFLQADGLTLMPLVIVAVVVYVVWLVSTPSRPPSPRRRRVDFDSRAMLMAEVLDTYDVSAPS